MRVDTAPELTTQVRPGTAQRGITANLVTECRIQVIQVQADNATKVTIVNQKQATRRHVRLVSLEIYSSFIGNGL